MKPERFPWDRALTAARWNFRHVPYIRESLGYLKHHPLDYADRILDFERLIDRMNGKLDNYPLVSNSSRRFGISRELTRFPDIHDLFGEYRAYYQSTGRRVFRDARLHFPEWANQKFELPATAASGILLEGYGLYLGHVYGNTPQERDRTRRNFVRIAEISLLRDMPNSPLLTDVAPWIKEEINSFPEALHEQIRNL